MIYWTLDCWVLANCNDCACDEYMNCISLLIKIKERDGICLDDLGEIYKEYTKHLLPRTFISKWWKVISRSTGKIHSCSSHLPSRYGNKLNSMRFDSDDIKYVGTAFNSPDRKLVAGESDYSTEVRDYLSNSCNIEVIHPSKCYDY